MSWPAIAAAIAAATGEPFAIERQRPAGGGCINTAYVLENKDGRRYFVKLNRPQRAQMFAAEADGLNALAAAQAVRVPRPITHGTDATHAWLVLEYLEFDGRGRAADLGHALAALHRVTQAQFGWWRDNAIGATPQCNRQCADWCEFWRECRLRPQFELARQNGASRALLEAVERLMADLDALLGSHRPLPSLLHGDLWGGNYGFSAGAPVLFDPAVYYGDREADLAMTELFGGFPSDFYAAYREAWPLEAGYATRKVLYNLYHVLNHFNMFGGGYGAQAERMARALLAQLR